MMRFFYCLAFSWAFTAVVMLTGDIITIGSAPGTTEGWFKILLYVICVGGMAWSWHEAKERK